MARRSGLGRGLGALIPPGVGPAPAQSEQTIDLTTALSADSPFRELPVTSITANTYQPRKRIDEDELRPLADSIRELGVLQPILVRKSGDGTYELIAGERRWRASQLAGLDRVPAIVRDVENVESLEQALVENLHRKDLNPLDEAAALRQLIDDFSMTHDDVGRRVGKSRAAVTNLLRLLQLPPRVQRLLLEEKLTAGHARALLGTEDAAFQVQLAERAARDSLSVRAVEEAIRLRNEVQTPRLRTSPTAKTPQAGVLELQNRLVDSLDTRVTISVGAKRGKIVIDFADVEDLDRIAQVIAHGALSEAEESSS